MNQPSSSIEALRAWVADPRVWPDGGPVEVEETHISLVALTPRWAFKVKKPLSLGFLDYGTLDLRRRACEAELRLNSRWAPGVYQGVLPLFQSAEGRISAEGGGRLVEYAVWMRRLANADRLSERLPMVGHDTMLRLGTFVARLHRSAARGGEVSRAASLEAITRQVLENFEQTRDHIGVTAHAQVVHRARRRSEEALALLGPTLQRRASNAREIHGDLRLEHVYLEGPDRFLLLDGVEFNPAYRRADPASELAFLMMELTLAGRPELAEAFLRGWIDQYGDHEARLVLPFYKGYRAIVRAKVLGIKALDPTASEAERGRARFRARRHWIYALHELEPPGRRPALILLSGLPGSGKSTIARLLAEQADFAVLRSDVVRKELAGLPPEASAAAPFGEGLYARDFTLRTYSALRDLARVALNRGERVLVDATLSSERERDLFLALAWEYGVPPWVIRLSAPDGVALARLRRRSGDASDADESVYWKAKKAFEPDGPEVAARTVVVDASRDTGEIVREIMAFLAMRGVAERATWRT